MKSLGLKLKEGDNAKPQLLPVKSELSKPIAKKEENVFQEFIQLSHIQVSFILL